MPHYGKKNVRGKFLVMRNILRNKRKGHAKKVLTAYVEWWDSVLQSTTITFSPSFLFSVNKCKYT